MYAGTHSQLTPVGGESKGCKCEPPPADVGTFSGAELRASPLDLSRLAVPAENVVAGEIVVAPGRLVAGGTVVAGAVVTEVSDVVVVGSVGAEPVNHGKDVVDTAVDWGAVDGGVTGEVNRSGTTAPDAAWDRGTSPAGEPLPPLASKTLGSPSAPMMTTAKLATKWL
jgi:hypothetical protein